MGVFDRATSRVSLHGVTPGDGEWTGGHDAHEKNTVWRRGRSHTSLGVIGYMK